MASLALTLLVAPSMAAALQQVPRTYRHRAYQALYRALAVVLLGEPRIARVSQPVGSDSSVWGVLWW